MLLLVANLLYRENALHFAHGDVRDLLHLESQAGAWAGSLELHAFAATTDMQVYVYHADTWHVFNPEPRPDCLIMRIAERNGMAHAFLLLEMIPQKLDAIFLQEVHLTKSQRNSF